MKKKDDHSKEVIRALAEAFPIIVCVHKSEDNSFWVESPQLGGCFAEGNSVGESLHNFKFAIFDYFDIPEELQKPEAFQIEALEIPEPKSPSESASAKLVPTSELALVC